MAIQITESQLFEMMGRLYAELLSLRVQEGQQTAQIEALLKEKDEAAKTEKAKKD